MSSATFISLWTLVILPLLGGGGLAGLAYSRKKAKASAESIVISNADGVVKMYEMLANRQQERIELLETNVREHTQEIRRLRARNTDLEHALSLHGIEVPHEV